jgi:hypothetical protein
MSASSVPTGLSLYQPAASKAVNQVLAHVGSAARELEALLVAKGVPPGKALSDALQSLSKAATALTDEATATKLCRERLEEQERRIGAVIKALVRIPSPPYIVIWIH